MFPLFFQTHQIVRDAECETIEDADSEVSKDGLNKNTVIWFINMVTLKKWEKQITISCCG